MINSGLEKLRKSFASWNAIWHQVESQRLAGRFKRPRRISTDQLQGRRTIRTRSTTDVATPKLASESRKTASLRNRVKLSAQSSSKAIATFSKCDRSQMPVMLQSACRMTRKWAEILSLSALVKLVP